MIDPDSGVVECVPPLTPERVIHCLAEAAATLRRLPDESGCGSWLMWPAAIRTWVFAERSADQDCVKHRLAERQAPDAVSHMEEAVLWLNWLEPNDLLLVWDKALGLPWKGIALRHDVTVRTAQRRWQYAVHLIVWRLHCRPVPKAWSRGFLIERVIALSRGKS